MGHCCSARQKPFWRSELQNPEGWIARFATVFHFQIEVDPSGPQGAFLLPPQPLAALSKKEEFSVPTLRLKPQAANSNLSNRNCNLTRSDIFIR